METELNKLADQLAQKAEYAPGVHIADVAMADGTLLVEHDNKGFVHEGAFDADVEERAVLEGDNALEAGADEGNIITAFVED
jgi:hypothetical protein